MQDHEMVQQAAAAYARLCSETEHPVPLPDFVSAFMRSREFDASTLLPGPAAPQQPSMPDLLENLSTTSITWPADEPLLVSGDSSVSSTSIDTPNSSAFHSKHSSADAGNSIAAFAALNASPMPLPPPTRSLRSLPSRTRMPASPEHPLRSARTSFSSSAGGGHSSLRESSYDSVTSSIPATPATASSSEQIRSALATSPSKTRSRTRAEFGDATHDARITESKQKRQRSEVKRRTDVVGSFERLKACLGDILPGRLIKTQVLEAACDRIEALEKENVALQTSRSRLVDENARLKTQLQNLSRHIQTTNQVQVHGEPLSRVFADASNVA